jgi:DNA ligase (NAD+)
MEHITKVKHNLLDFLKTAPPKALVETLKFCSDSYYNTNTSHITDEEYDRIREHLEESDPKNPYLLEVGAPINEDKITLPYWMGSMNKKKTQEQVEKWEVKYPGEVVISDKLDGISFLLTHESGETRLYSRGNGKEGKDLGYLLKYIKLPTSIKDLGKLAIRGEILISKENFKKIKSEAANTRSFISGISNLKKIDTKKKMDLKKVDLVCFELIYPEMKPSAQFEFLNDNGFNCVNNQIFPTTEFEKLKEILLKRKEECKYDIDGIIVCQNLLLERNLDKNPKYAFAFKMDMEFAFSTVIDVEWNQSKHGKLKPLVLIEQVVLGGTNVKAATGNNADFIVKHKIGPGAKVKIIKGGEIIPKIVEVIDGKEPKLPDCDFVWNETKKEILLQNIEDNDEVKIKRITSFFKTIGVEHIGPGIFKKLYDNGYQNIQKIMDITKEQLLELPGIKEKSANNILENLSVIIDNPISIEKVIAGSCILGTGLGIRILEKIVAKHPQLFVQEIEINLEQLTEIPSIEVKTAQKILNKLPDIRNFIKQHPRIQIKLPEKKKKKIIKKGAQPKSAIEDMKIVITGKRDKEILKLIEDHGATLQSAINKSTNILLAENKDIKNTKITKAEELGITIYNFEEFKSLI